MREVAGSIPARSTNACGAINRGGTTETAFVPNGRRRLFFVIKGVYLVYLVYLVFLVDPVSRVLPVGSGC